MGKRKRGFSNLENLPKGTSSIPPSIVALLIFTAAVVCAFFLIFMLVPVLGFRLSSPWFYFVFIQALLSAGIAYCFGMEWWWWLILFLFPFAVAVAYCLNMPAYYYLLAFFLFLILFWSTFRTQVPYYPSSSKLPALILNLLPDKSVRVIDVGSGFGGLMLHLATDRPDSCFWGIEIAPFPWLVSVLRNKLVGGRVQFMRGDYNDLDFANYDIVFAYLSPRAMPDLWLKAKNEMCSGAMLLSYEFIIPDKAPDMCINSGKNNPNLYVWRI